MVRPLPKSNGRFLLNRPVGKLGLALSIIREYILA